jgi:hypothetical protein
MIIIPGYVIALFTFPGVIVHELAHQLFCRLLQVPIFKVCYFRLGTPSGYVLYEPPRSSWKNLLIGIGPLLVNTLVGLSVAFPAAINIFTFESWDWLDGLLIWLGISIAMHSFPSTGDAATIWKSVMAPGSPLLARIVGAPLVGLIWMGAVGSFFWLNAVYGACVVTLVPNLIVKSLAGSG